MRLLALEGNHFQMGLQHGQQVVDLRPRIIEDIDRRLEGLPGREAADLVAEVERCWVQQAGSTLDMLAGMAEALDLDRAHLLRSALSSYVTDALAARGRVEGCTVWAASGPATAGRAPMMAKNRDYSLAHLPFQALADARPDDGYRHLYVTSAGSPGVFSSGMNEVGLAVADTHVLSADLGPGLARYTLMMDVLERHASVMSALAHLQDTPRMGGGNLILLDAAGEMAVFETGHRHYGVIPADQHIVAATNHFITPALRGEVFGRDDGGPDGNSQARWRSIYARLRDRWGRLDTGEAAQIMAAHDDGEAALCRHDAGRANGTISSIIFLPAERSLLFCHGRPCEAAYTRYSF
jgi:isopenicillin-N N-acyltransferase-like protein